MEAETNRTVEVVKTENAAQKAMNHTSGPGRKGRFSSKKLAGLILLVVLVGFAVWWSWWLFGRDTTHNENQAINTGQFQAVFLTNGQVYFGKLADLNNKYVTMTDIYYLQVQQSNGSLQNASGSANSNSQVSLAKLGSELHGPEDKMSISSDQVLFWENLKSNSKVVEAIQKYQNQ
jgi:hypothetical protein